MQYIGRLMRDVDPAPIEAALAAWARGPAQDRARFAALEQWRDRLLSDADALEEFVAAYPKADRKRLTVLVAAVHDERARNSPPRQYRELFRMIRSVCEDAP